MIRKLLPGLKKLVPYDISHLPGDITAGVIVTFLLLPQSIAYATIAGAPITMGLLAGTFPLIIYALFGSSNYLSVGPVSMASLLAFAGISRLTDVDSEQFLELMILLSLLVGIVQLMMGILKFGSIVKHISQAVIGGFTSALAIIIILNQIGAIMGVTLPEYQNIGASFLAIIEHIPKANVLTVLLGCVSFIFLIQLKRKFPISPGPFIVIFVSIVAVDYFDLDTMGVEIVGAIPKTFSDVSMVMPTIDMLISLMPIACIIAILSFFESFSIAKTLADKEKGAIYPNQEFVSLGFANMTSSFVGSIPVAGSISRTAVNYESGARTNLSLFTTAVLMVVAILYMTPSFYYLPKTVLAAIIIYAVMKLINVRQLKGYIRHSLWDAVIFLTTFLATLMVNMFIGLVIGMILSFGMNR
ncbi:SulP family inorganic anion transporter [Lentibacillus salinarum]|uniref:SulP family inorganic anion transporter n=1 Tax=Lentibacillus salinarum TaxID=446820 RepID=A0ABW3ZVK7_9BACI